MGLAATVGLTLILTGILLLVAIAIASCAVWESGASPVSIALICASVAVTSLPPIFTVVILFLLSIFAFD